MNEQELNEIKARAEAATPGPWRRYNWDHVSNGDEVVCDTRPESNFPNEFAENADFIAYARTDVPALVAEVERLNGLVEALAIAVEDETGMLSDAPLTAEKMEEILHTLKYRYENANEFLGDYVKETMLLNSEVERLNNQCKIYAERLNWQHEQDTLAYAELSIEAERRRHELTVMLTERLMPLEQENARLKKALEFYADEKNWEMEGPGKHWTVDAYQDAGDIARQALKGGEG